MKAHIMKMQESAVLFALSRKHQEKAKEILEKLSIRVRISGREDLPQTVGFLAGCTGFRQKTPEQLEVPRKEAEEFFPAMIMAGLTDSKLDRVLAALRNAGIQIPLKAVVTSTNQNWTLSQLLRELEREHAAFQKPSPKG